MVIFQKKHANNSLKKSKFYIKILLEKNLKSANTQTPGQGFLL